MMRNKFCVLVLVVILSAILGKLHYVGSAKAVTLPAPASGITADFFGLHIHRAVTTTPWPVAAFGTWRLWDCYVQWPWLEPRKGEWHFETLDRIVSLAEKHKVKIVLPLGLSPTWASARPLESSAYGIGRQGFAAEPKNIDDWRTYVSTVARRYKGRIKEYEIWNEPNLPNFYSGSQEHMLTLAREAYRILKEADPAVTVVSPAATGEENGPSWLDGYLAKGGGTFADVIGYHFYVSPKPPESMLPLIMRIQQVMGKHHVDDKPLWNTETGWFIANRLSEVKSDASGFRGKVLSEAEASGYIARAYILSWASGVKRLYWYSWDNEELGLTEVDGKTLKSPAFAYAEVCDWLLGSRMIACSSDASDTWKSRLRRSDGSEAWRVVSLEIQKSWGFNEVRNLERQRRGVKAGDRIEVGPLPVLLWKKM